MPTRDLRALQALTHELEAALADCPALSPEATAEALERLARAAGEIEAGADAVGGELDPEALEAPWDHTEGVTLGSNPNRA